MYVEKPCSHNVFEGRKLVEAARKYDRIVQHGTQSRSDPHWVQEMAAVRSGKYGKLLISYGYASKPRRSIGFKHPRSRPRNSTSTSGSARPRSSRITRTSSTTIGTGSGISATARSATRACIRWTSPAGPCPTGPRPRASISLGGRFGYKDQGQTPNTQLTVIDFGGPKLFFEDRGLVDGKTTKVTNEFYTEAGVIRDGKFFPKGKKAGEPLASVLEARPAGATLRAIMENCVSRHFPPGPQPTFRQLHRLRPEPQT